MVTIAEEAKFERNAEKMLKGQRELPAGRDFRAFKGRDRADMGDDFEKRFDDTFPDAPGSSAWFDKKFKGKKEKEGMKVGYHRGGFLG
jgi:hypothetical protein